MTKKPMIIQKKIQWIFEKKIFVNIIKRCSLNTFKRSQQSYLIAKQELNWERDNLVEKNFEAQLHAK
jgi:hypothetical protein